MKTAKFFLYVLLIGLLLALAGSASLGLAQGPEPPEGAMQPQGGISIAATVSSKFSYQGVLKENGSPVTGSRDMIFRLYSDNTCSTQVSSDIVKSGVQVTDGLFSVELLDATQGAFNGQDLWLAVYVEGTRIGCQEILAVPYALSLRPGANIVGNTTSIVSVENQNSADYSKGIYSFVSAGSGLTYGVYGRSDSTAGRGVFGWAYAASGTTFGVYGKSDSTAGHGVHGYASAASGVTYGVYGSAKSPNGYGGYFVNTATSGLAHGVWGSSASTAGYGVVGYTSATSGTNYGVWGQSSSTGGRGVLGYATATSGEAYGVFGRSDSTTGRGMYGLANATTGTNYGVYGQSASTSGRGVSGTSPYIGVYGHASATSGTNFGVYGYSASPAGYAGYFYGNVHVNGDLSASGSKPFKIDHPLDPASKYLYHFAQESPEVQNVYNGVVTLDANGEAAVTLPEYFSALNTGPYRYQLTPIGAPMPNLYIAQEIQGNTFRIAGGVPGKKVSWEVTAVRNDPYLRDHPVQTEEDKPAEEKGTYLYPEGYGQPQEMGLDYQRNTDLLNVPDGQ